ncbi:glycine cleavage system aminomethyltransferase GcvT [Pseudohalocynthiibacter aestuariivivens]|uniref:aminomethyltransferase n=1 Tax=Roseovarius pelagicus TaxID=2980108 RepID=A0ABY6D8Q0_9RHOB|nr:MULTISPECIES: glycine cleavage system aminomethyltransferase GcvT [Rhodobacterales]QIE45570.1 glycine cleavage system aminomethyltransferase GcvT [Pseudohalocynthiibacter aestuariivivens]UXX82512.1 glycine cleavage system aminomethyltransferase GcvT [Roseovarius pelagicus]
MSDLRVTPLNALHKELGAKMVPFAGYEMPVQYPLGVMKEHLHCRAEAGLFDVSHMGQVIIRAPGGYDAAATAFETLVPVNALGLGEGRQRYAMFTNDKGGIEDDLMIANRGDHMFVVVNAACKEADITRMTTGLPECEVTEITDRALLALQGPGAEAALEALVPGVASMTFMDVGVMASDWGELWISRSGYTGEDGYEISVPEDQSEALARALIALDAVEPIGLGARDSLRLEAGLCLYGHDIDSGTTPVEAALTWAIQKVRRNGGARAGGFPGADTILAQLDDGPTRRRVGLRPEGRAPMREGTELYAGAEGGDVIGHVTSGAFGPTLGGPMSMGYVTAGFADDGTTIYGDVRGKRLPATITALPFVPANFKR